MINNTVLRSATTLRVKLAATLIDDEGAGLAEYALLLLLIAIVCIGALTALGTTISGAYNTAVGMFN